MLDETPRDVSGGGAATSSPGPSVFRVERSTAWRAEEGVLLSERAGAAVRGKAPGGKAGSWTEGTVTSIVQFQFQIQFQIHVVPEPVGVGKLWAPPGPGTTTAGEEATGATLPGCPGSPAGGFVAACPLVWVVELVLFAVAPDDAAFACTMTMLLPGLPIVIGIATLTGWA